jgi:hypothetical protein
MAFRTASSMRRGELAEAEARLDAKLGVGAPLPTRTHEVALEVFEEMLRLGLELSESNGAEQAPVQFKVILRMINESRPLMAKYIAKAPVGELQRFMSMLIAKMQRIVDEGQGGPHADPPADSDRALADRSTA